MKKSIITIIFCGLAIITLGQSIHQGLNLACVNNNTPPNNGGTDVKVSLPIGNWSYITLTKSATNVCNLYVNGVNIFSGNYANISYSWSNLILGAGFGSNYFNYFNGSIDEVRISNSVRSALDISNYFNSDSPFVADANTIGLWHFDQNTGSTVNGIIGGNGTTNAVWGSGIFGNALLYNGTTSHTDFNFSTPTTNSTIEFWIKPDSIALSWPLMTCGYNSAGLILNPYVSTNTSKITGPSIAYINIFPNPTKDRITIDNGDITKMSGYSIKIFNSIGQQKYQSAINQQQFTIDITQLGSNGLYYLNLIDDSGNIVVVKKILLNDGLNK